MAEADTTVDGGAEAVEVAAAPVPADAPAAAATEESGSGSDAGASASASASSAAASSPETSSDTAPAAAAAAEDDDDDEKAETDEEAVYRTPSTAGRGYVVCYGWMVKQGEGGFLKRKNWKKRFFVLYKVPHGSVLVYYNTDKPDAENIMGFVDLRQVEAINVSKQPVNGADRDVIEVVTKPRTYYVSPVSVQRSITSASSGECINILGWPVAELEVGALYDAEKEGYATQRRVQETWVKSLRVACLFKKATMHAEVTTVTDSTTVLPDSVYVMVTPSDVVLLDGTDRDKAFACWPYRDLASWRAESRKDLQINVRSVSNTIRCTFAVSDDIPRDTGFDYATTALDLKTRIDKHIKELVSLKKKTGA